MIRFLVVSVLFCAQVLSLLLESTKISVYQGSRGCSLVDRNGKFNKNCSMPPLYHSYDGFVLDQSCESSTANYHVLAMDADASTFMFADPPSINSCGSLRFVLNPDRNSKPISFSVHETTSGAMDAFQMFIAPVNTAPNFTLVPYIDVYQDSGGWHGPVAFDVNPGRSMGAWNESGQQVSLRILESPSTLLFDTPPTIQLAGSTGILSFSVAPQAVGNATLAIIAVDNGGTVQGGVNRSIPQLLVISVVPWNHAPSFALGSDSDTPVIQVAEGTVDLVLPNFARNITPGPPNEACTPPNPFAGMQCQPQALSFVLDFVDRPEIFGAPPVVSPDGTLHLRVMPLPVGLAARVWLHLEDDGGASAGSLRAPAAPGGPPPQAPNVSNQSPTAFFIVVQVLRGNRSAGFSLAVDAVCPSAAPCSCSALQFPAALAADAAAAGGPCRQAGIGSLNGTALVTVDEAASPGVTYLVKGFASHLTTAQPYEPAAVAVFTRDRASGSVRYQGRARDPLRSAVGMEYVTSVAVSPDGAHVYGAEPETSSIVAFRCVGAGAPCATNRTADLEFIERRAGGERRLRFRGWNTSRPISKSPATFATPAITEWVTFRAGGGTLAVAAAGGEPLRALVRPGGPLGPDRPAEGAGPPPVPGEQDSLWGSTMAMWTFDLQSVMAPAGISEADLNRRFPPVRPFLVQAVDNTTGAPMLQSLSAVVNPTFACGPDGCSYARPVVALNPDADRLRLPMPWATYTGPGAYANATATPVRCAESFPTSARRATLRDRAGIAGPLVLAGPACKAAAGSDPEVANDWDILPERQLDLLTFATTNLVASGMQFDGVLNPGLTLAASLDGLVDGRPATSRLPLNALSVEIWFTIRADPWVPVSDNSAGPRRGLLGVEAYLTYDLAKVFDSRFGTSALGSGFCAKGWSLSYFHTTQATTFEFHIFTEGLASSDMMLVSIDIPPNAEPRRQGAPWNLVYTVTPAVANGVWQHLVATYDGTNAQMFLNGQPSLPKRVCAASQTRAQGCGRILYPASYSFAADKAGQPSGFPTSTSPQMCMQNASYPFMVGHYKNGMRGIVTSQWLSYLAGNPASAYGYSFADDNMSALPHIGDVHMIRLYNLSLQTQDVMTQFAQRSATLAENDVSSPYYWAVSELNSPGKSRSPSIDFSLLAIQNMVTVHGFFSRLSTYYCQWQFLDGFETALTPAIVSKDATMLDCLTPLWRFGVRATTFNIVDSSSALYGETTLQWDYVLKTVSFSDANPKSVWMKVCIEKSCNFPVTAYARENWYWGDDTGSSGLTLSNQVFAIPHMFRFVASSTLFAFGSFASAVWAGRVPIGTIIVYSSGQFYAAGDLRIFDSFGSAFLGKYQVSASGSIEDSSIVNVGTGYDTSGSVVPCYLNSTTPMENSVSAIFVVDGGDSFIAGRWEIDGGPFNATTNASGVFDVTSQTGSISMDSFLFRSHGSNFNSSNLNTSNVLIFYPNSWTLQAGSISQVQLNELASIDQIVKQLKSCVDNHGPGSFCLQASAYCLPNTIGCTGGGFTGICTFSDNPQTLSVRIIDYGHNYNRSAKPVIACGSASDISLYQNVLVASIPGGHSLRVRVATGAVLRYTAKVDFPLKTIQEFGTPSRGVWNNSAQWCGGPLSVAVSSALPFTAHGNVTYLILSNTWDGVHGNRNLLLKSGHSISPLPHSVLFQFYPETFRVCAKQIIYNSASQRWKYFEFQGMQYLAAAKFASQSQSGYLSTLTWSAVYRFTPGVDMSKNGECLSQTSLCSVPWRNTLIDTENSSEFLTQGASAIQILTMNSTERSGQIQLLVVANYYESEKVTFRLKSRIYLLGRPVTNTSSIFSAGSLNYWRRCTDTSAVCSANQECRIHKCNQKCIVRQEGDFQTKTCQCKNTGAQCNSDSECNTGINCTYSYAPAIPESHYRCWADNELRFNGIDPMKRLTMCKIQELDTIAAQNVEYVRSDNKHFLAFSSDQISVFPQIFFADDGFPDFGLMSPVEAKGAQNIAFFRSVMFDTLFLLAPQSSSSVSSMFRFNGTEFQNISDQMFQSPDNDGGGQLVSFEFARSISYFSDEQPAFEQIDTTGISWNSGPVPRNKDFILIGGGYLDGYVLDGVTSIFAGLTEENYLDVPSTILVSPDGAHVYVSDIFSGSIVGFLRDPATGLLFTSDGASYFSASRMKANLGQFQTHPGSPREAFTMAMSGDGKNLYTVGMFDNALHTFMRDKSMGSLLYTGTIYNEINSSMKLLMPRAITVSHNGLYVYVAASEFQSILTFNRSKSDGSLTFIDSLWNGERAVKSMNTSLILKRMSDELPTVLGSTKIWAGRASACKLFVIRRVQYLAVAASDAPCFLEQELCTPSTGERQNAVVILKWNVTTGTFQVEQEIWSARNAVDIEFFVISNVYYLAIADIFDGTSVYVFDSSKIRFAFHHKLPMAELPYDSNGISCVCNTNQYKKEQCGVCFDDGVIHVDNICVSGPDSERSQCTLQRADLTPRALTYFSGPVGNINKAGNYLIVAYLSLMNSSVKGGVYSIVYRWFEDEIPLPGGSFSLQSKFVIMQAIPTFGAVAVDCTVIDRSQYGPRQILSFANYAWGQAHNFSIYELRPTSRLANPNLTAQWQSLPFGSTSEYSKLIAEVYFEELSTFSAFGVSALKFFSVPYQGSFLAIAHKNSTSSWLTVNKWNSDRFDSIQVLNGDEALNVSGFEFFTSVDGEHYLAIAQCSCTSSVNCSSSAILQFNKRFVAFGEVLSITDHANLRLRGRNISFEDILHHQQALRIPAGMVLQWTAGIIGESTYLIASSQTFGFVLYNFSFKTEYDLSGIISLATNPDDSCLFLASESSLKLIVISSTPNLDSKKKKVSEISLISSIMEQKGLYGIESVSVENWNCGGFLTNETSVFADGEVCDLIFVRNKVPRDSFLCGPYPPISTQSPRYQPAAECQLLSFSASILPNQVDQIDAAGIFDTIPTILSEGSEQGALNFSLNSNQAGRVSFIAALSKNGSKQYDQQNFYIQVLRFKRKPVLNLQDVFISNPSDEINRDVFGEMVIDPDSRNTDIAVNCFYFDFLYLPVVNVSNITNEFTNPNWSESPLQLSYECKQAPFSLQQLNDSSIDYEGTPHFMRLVDLIRNQSNQTIPVQINSYSVESACQEGQNFDDLTPLNGFAAGPTILLNASNILRVDTQFLSANRFRVPICVQVADVGKAGDNKTIVSDFSCFVVLVNPGPKFVTRKDLIVVSEQQQEGTLFVEPSFIINERPECLGQIDNFVLGKKPRFSFSLLKIEKLHVIGWTSSDVFQFVRVNTTSLQYLNGTYTSYYSLVFELHPFFNGDIAVFILVQDALLSHFGGIDTTTVSFHLNITFVNTPPVLLLSDGVQAANHIIVHLQSGGEDASVITAGVFMLFQPIDERLTEQVFFDVVILSGTHLFLSPPVLQQNGELRTDLKRWACGMSTWQVIISDNGPGHNNSNEYIFDVSVYSLPVIHMPKKLSTASSDVVSDHNFPFASIEGLCVLSGRIGLILETKCYSESLDMFSQDPYIDNEGILYVQIQPFRSGVAWCQTRVNQEILPVLGTTVAEELRWFNISVLPPVIVTEVHPGLVGEFLSSVITIYGRNFGSAASRGHSSSSYGNITASIGRGGRDWTPCLKTAYRSDERIVCALPAIFWGRGALDLLVVVQEDGIRRNTTMSAGLRAARIIYGGAVDDVACSSKSSTSAVCGTPVHGFLAVGSSGNLDNNNSDIWVESVDLLQIAPDAGVRALAKVANRLLVGGAFKFVGTVRYNYIVSVDSDGGGAMSGGVQGFGMGVDGPVLAVASFGENAGSFLIGGIFSRAYNMRGKTQGIVDTGGLALWNASSDSWELLGGAAVLGQVMAMVVDPTGVETPIAWIGGRFGSIGDQNVMNVAFFNGSNWAAMGAGVGGGEVLAIAVMGSYTFVGGNIHFAGALGAADYVDAENIAVWDGFSWGAVVDDTCVAARGGAGAAGCGLDGTVHALAAMGGHIFAGGSFKAAGGRQAAGVARFYSGMWAPLGGGVDGVVYALAVALPPGPIRDRSSGGACLYVAGAFSLALEEPGTDPSVLASASAVGAGGVARRCFGDSLAPYAPADVMESPWYPVAPPPVGSLIRSIAVWD